MQGMVINIEEAKLQTLVRGHEIGGRFSLCTWIRSRFQTVEMLWGSDRFSAIADADDFMKMLFVLPAGMSASKFE